MQKAIKIIACVFAVIIVAAILRIIQINAMPSKVENPPTEWELLSEEYERCVEFANEIADKPQSQYTARDAARIEQCLEVKRRLSMIQKHVRAR